MLLEIGGPHDRARQNAISKSWREAFDLLLDAWQHVGFAAVRHVTVRPRRMASLGRARGVEERGLREQHERMLADSSLPGVALRLRDFLDRSAEMDAGGLRASCCTPRDRRIQRPVHLEHSHAVTVPFELPPVPRRETVPRNLQ